MASNEKFATLKKGIHVVDTEYGKHVAENRHCITSIIEILRLIAVKISLNMPNVKEKHQKIVETFWKFSIQLLSMMRIASGRGNAKYTHHSIQDALITMSDIQSEVALVEYFSII